MRILFDLVHPADPLFFYHAIRRLEADGATILIASRRKDVLIQLLDEMGFAHQVLTTASRGLVGQSKRQHGHLR